MGFLQQLGLLLWKNFMLRRRQPLRVVIEIVWPLCLFLILVAVKTRKDLIVLHPECHYDGKAMPSTGLLSFMQSYACTFTNNCHQRITEDELRNNVESFNTSLISILINDLEKVFSNNVERQEITNLIEDFSNFRVVLDKIARGESQGEIKLGNLLVNPDRLREQIANQSINLSPESLNVLLNASISLREVFNLTNTPNLFNMSTLREEICQENYLTRWFNFSDPDSANQLHQQLCNLTSAQAQELVNDFREEFNRTYTLQEIQKFWRQNSGSDLNFNLQTVELFGDLMRDFGELESFRFLLNDVERIQNDILGSNRTNMTSALQNVGLLLCGRSQILLPSVSNTSQSRMMQNTLNPNERAKAEKEYENAKLDK